MHAFITGPVVGCCRRSGRTARGVTDAGSYCSSGEKKVNSNEASPLTAVIETPTRAVVRSIMNRPCPTGALTFGSGVSSTGIRSHRCNDLVANLALADQQRVPFVSAAETIETQSHATTFLELESLLCGGGNSEASRQLPVA